MLPPTYAAFLVAASFCLVSGKVATRKMYRLEAAMKKIMAGVYPEEPKMKLQIMVAIVWPA